MEKNYEVSNRIAKNVLAILDVRRIDEYRFEDELGYQHGYFKRHCGEAKIAIDNAIEISEKLEISLEELISDNIMAGLEKILIERQIKELQERLLEIEEN